MQESVRNKGRHGEHRELTERMSNSLAFIASIHTLSPAHPHHIASRTPTPHRPATGAHHVVHTHSAIPHRLVTSLPTGGWTRETTRATTTPWQLIARSPFSSYELSIKTCPSIIIARVDARTGSTLEQCRGPSVSSDGPYY